MYRRLFGTLAAVWMTMTGVPAVAEDATASLEDHARGRRFDYAHAHWLVDLLYEGALFRQPDPGAQGWVNLIVRNGYQGLLQVAEGIGGSPEFSQVVWNQGPDNIVYNLYGTWLQREPDQQGYWGWVQRLERGDYRYTLRDFVGSQEFFQRNVAPWR